MIFIIAACKTQIICKEVKETLISPAVFCDISFKFNRCRCRCFDFNNYSKIDDSFCGGDFVSDNYPLSYCEGIAGFFAETNAIDVKPKILRLAKIRKDTCGF